PGSSGVGSAARPRRSRLGPRRPSAEPARPGGTRWPRSPRLGRMGAIRIVPTRGDPMTVVVTAVFHPKPGKQQELAEAMRRGIAAVHTEDGCERYAIHDAEGGAITM